MISISDINPETARSLGAARRLPAGTADKLVARIVAREECGRCVIVVGRDMSLWTWPIDAQLLREAREQRLL